MNEPWKNDNCETIRAYFSYYSVPQAALLWCGVPIDRVDKELALALPISSSSEAGKSILKHPYIPCLEPRCRAIQNAIKENKLKVGRDGGRTFYMENDHVAYSRRTLTRTDLREWIAREFPNEKPAFLFDEIERSTHTAINAETFRTLQADRDALATRLEKAKKAYRNLQQEYDAIKGERDSLKTIVEKMAAPGERAETTYLNIIGGLLGLMLGKSPAGKQQSVFDNQAAIISALLGHYEGKRGIAARTLEEKFAAAKRSLSSS
ncbi:MAG: hypothetical protein ACXW03_05825 [Methylobacter sp.]